MKTPGDAIIALNKAWPHIVDECRGVLGSELHYQAVIYHCLRSYGNVPIKQIGMNVKMWITAPRTELFRKFDLRKAEDYRGGFEPIPDIVLFSPKIEGDFRRRNCEQSLLNMLMAIEVKASERHKGRLTRRELIGDIEKLQAHREEVRFMGADMLPVVIAIDTAPDLNERMKAEALRDVIATAQVKEVRFCYLSPIESSIVE